MRECSFNMTRGYEDIEGGGGGSLKQLLGLEGRLPKFVYFKTNRRGGGGGGAPKERNR